MSPEHAGMDKDSITTAVQAELRGQLGLADVPIADGDRLDLLPGADSVRLMRTVSELERRFDVEFDDDAIRRAETVGDLVRLVADGVASEDGLQ